MHPSAQKEHRKQLKRELNESQKSSVANESSMGSAKGEKK
jgi:hypothetical protein